MTWLYVLLGIVLFLVFLLSLKVKLRVKYNKGELSYKLSILGIPLERSPLPPNEKPINYRKFTYKKHKKRILKESASQIQNQRAKSEKKKATKLEKTAKKPRKNQSEHSKTEGITEALGIVWIFIKNFAKRLHVKIAYLKVNVSKDDAAGTAIAYGAAVQSVNYFIELLGNVTNIDKLEKADIEVNADYTGQRSTLELYFIFHLRVYKIIGLLFSTIFDFIKKLAEKNHRPPQRRPSPARKGMLKASPGTVKNQKAKNKSIY